MSNSLPFYAFEILSTKLLKSTPYSINQVLKYFNESLSSFPKNCPIFVTWNKSNTLGDKDLRGCIGTFADIPFPESISKYALIAGLNDPRFAPITPSEFVKLSVHITILTNFEEARDIFDWEIGVHGIKIFFSFEGKDYDGTFLPSVAVEQGWDKITTLKHLVKKTGVSKKVDLKELDIELTRYQGDVYEMGYDEYVDYREGFV